MNSFFKPATAALLLGCLNLARGAPIDPGAIRLAVQETVQEAAHKSAHGGGGGAGDPRSKGRNTVAPRMGQPGGGEDDSCLLNFGFDGALGGRSFTSHVLGRTQVWRGQ